MDSEWGLDFCSLRSWIMSLQACYCASRCPPDYLSYGSTPTPSLSMAVNHLWVIICRRNYSNVFCGRLEFLRRVLRFPSDRSRAVKTIFWRLQTNRYTNRRWAERWADHEKSCSSSLHQLCVCVFFFLLPPRSPLFPGEDEWPLTYSVGPLCWVFLRARAVCRLQRCDYICAWRARDAEEGSPSPLTFTVGLQTKMPQLIVQIRAARPCFSASPSHSLCSSSFLTSFIYSFWLNWMNNWPQIDRCRCCLQAHELQPCHRCLPLRVRLWV